MLKPFLGHIMSINQFSEFKHILQARKITTELGLFNIFISPQKETRKKGEGPSEMTAQKEQKNNLPNPNLLSVCTFQLNNKHRTPPVRKQQYTHY